MWQRKGEIEIIDSGDDYYGDDDAAHAAAGGGQRAGKATPRGGGLEVIVMVRSTALPPLIVVSADDIAERAYAIYEERGRADGHDREDWLRAERELAALPTSARRQPRSSSTKRLSTKNRSHTKNRAPR